MPFLLDSLYHCLGCSSVPPDLPSLGNRCKNSCGRGGKLQQHNPHPSTATCTGGFIVRLGMLIRDPASQSPFPWRASAMLPRSRTDILARRQKQPTSPTSSRPPSCLDGSSSTPRPQSSFVFAVYRSSYLTDACKCLDLPELLFKSSRTSAAACLYGL